MEQKKESAKVLWPLEAINWVQVQTIMGQDCKQKGQEGVRVLGDVLSGQWGLGVCGKSQHVSVLLSLVYIF